MVSMRTERQYSTQYPTPITVLAWGTLNGTEEDRERAAEALARMILEEIPERATRPERAIIR